MKEIMMKIIGTQMNADMEEDKMLSLIHISEPTRH